MLEEDPEIVKYSDSHRDQILDIWEKSVLATHNFLIPSDFVSIKEIVKTIDFNAFQVYCLIHNQNVIGFLGVAEQKLEMLFLSPEYFGKGMGKKLVRFAISELGVNSVDVNEQNSGAVEFYHKCGFKTYDRSETDGQGKNYPLLKMMLT
jgi:putative acetyltransferase